MSATQEGRGLAPSEVVAQHAVLAYASTSTTAWLVIHPDWAMCIPFDSSMLWVIADDRRRRLS